MSRKPTATPAGASAAMNRTRFQQHELIRASAGAGKTFALSNRYLTLLRQGASPDQIVAITFTRKAAGEILGRVLMRLAAASLDEAGARRLAGELGDPTLDLPTARAMLGRLVAALHRVSIGTIDSFFHRIVHTFRHELGVPAAANIVAEEDPAARQVRSEAIDAMLADNDPQVLIDLLRRLHHDRAARSVTDAIDQTVSNLYQVYLDTQAPAWRRLAEPPTLSRVEVVEAINALIAAESALPADKRFARAWQASVDSATRLDWQTFINTGLAKPILSGQPTYYKKPIPDPLLAAYEPLVNHARNELIARIVRRTAAMHELIERFDGHFRRLRDRHRLLLFSDLPRRLALQMPEQAMAEVYYRLDQQVAHLMLDEFQDTSPQQWRVLRPIAEEIRAHAQDPEQGARRGFERSFFCVGDVKQAIYGWRGGCAELFDAVEQDLHLPADAAQTLSRSYRTSPIVLEAVNRVFGSIADSPPLAELRHLIEPWQRGFETHEAFHVDRPGYVQLRSSVLGSVDAQTVSSAAAADDTDGEGDDADAASIAAPTPHEVYVAEHVAKLHEQTPGCSLGVLVQRNNTVRKLIYLLRQMQVPASGEGGSPVTDDPAVGAVLAALTLADHPAHSAAAFHVLHSPLGPIVELRSTDESEAARVGRNIRRHLLSDGYARLIAQWTRQLAPSCHARSLARLTQLVELAERYDPDLTLRTRDFVSYVETTVVEEPASAPVRVMTVHKAKGLEFDIVVLPELHARLARIHKAEVWCHRPRPIDPPDGVFATMKQESLDLIESACGPVVTAREQERYRRLHDDLCALYVAMTRPRYALHMIIPPVKPTKDGTPGKSFLSDVTPAAVLRHALTDTSNPLGEDRLLASFGDEHWAKHLETATAAPAVPLSAEPLRVHLASLDVSRRSWQALSPSALEDGGRVSVDRLLGLGDASSLRFGSAIHAMFEQVGWLDDAEPDEATLRAAARAVAPAADDARLDQWLDSFRRMLAHDAVRQTLSRDEGDPGALTLWRERPFAVRMEGRLLSGTFDRVVIRRQADRVRVRLIDFKTDAYSEAAVERYRPQITAYRAALAQMHGAPVEQIEAILLFVNAGKAVAL